MIYVNGIVGAAGIESTLAALKAGKRVALSNKETLVMAGDLVTRAAQEGGGEIVPVDSDHSAVSQCLTGRRPTELARSILTASGGPLRTCSPARAAAATVAEGLQHPTCETAGKAGGTAAAVFNAANEVAVELFLGGGLTFGRIAEVIERVLEAHPGGAADSLEAVLAADAAARQLAREAACA